MLRIIAGKYRHLLINSPNINSTRPTTDKVREGIMSALSQDLDSSIVLDLFAGSGALGLEALSRGARRVIFNDYNSLAFKTINDNILKLKITENVEVHKLNYLKCLENLNTQVDIVFLDPPYKDEIMIKNSVDYLISHQLLTNNAIVVKESNKLLEFDERFNFHRRYQYGTIHVLIERK